MIGLPFAFSIGILGLVADRQRQGIHQAAQVRLEGRLGAHLADSSLG